jgi:hypothetical protein
MATHMDPKDAFIAISKSSHKSMRQISSEMGHRAEYLSVIISKSKIPRIDTFAKVANMCEWDIIARKRDDGTEIFIDSDPIEPDDTT